MQIKSYIDSKGRTRYKFNAYLGIDEVTGKEIRTNRSGFKSEKQAILAYANLKNEKIQTSQNPTFKDLSEEWLELYKDTVKYSSFKRINSIFRTHIFPEIGKRRVKNITTRVIQNLITRKSKQMKDFKRINTYCSRVFELAITRKIVTDNPCKGVVYPVINNNYNKPKNSIDFWEKDELITFLKCCKSDLDLMWYTYFWILSFTGMRKGEAQALNWTDINFVKKELTVNKTLSTYGDDKKFISTPKTSSSWRIISLDDQTLSLLSEWKKEQKTWLQKSTLINKKQTIVFSDSNNDYTYHNQPRRKFLKVVNKNKLTKIRLHDLRHTHASLCFEAGWLPKDVQDRLGHSSIRTTMDIYTKITKNRGRENVEKFSNFMNIESLD